jgi:signal transduction histidine kinase
VPRDVAVTAIRLEGNIVLAFCEDVTDRKRAEDEVRSANASLERRVAARTVQLEQVNRELEAFAYSVSHDLRAPLRALDGYSALLEQDAAERLDETCRGYLASIRRSAARMSTLIDDLLTLSRASRQDLRVGPVDMDALVKHVLREVLPAGELERTDVVVHPLPAAVGDEGLLRQVWTNLLNNAVKFSSKRPRRSIEVGSRTEGGETAYFVRDNGVGFAPEFGPKLFNAFQRLHDGRDFEGTGVGLALVRRIVERHGGRIGAESLVDGGATFWFTLGGSPAS